MLCNRVLRGALSLRTVPWGALGISLFAGDLYLASAAAGAASGGGELIGIGEYLSRPASWRVLADLTMIAVSAGLFIVPLYTLLQSRGDPAQRSRIIGANNILNACFMVLAALATVAMLKLDFSVPDVFLAVAVANLAVVAAAFRLRAF
jgi:acyl-[acyl-carrier-protein]-phospholipid O-acyltransferase/long-chain-fatty-acid--[acyl-carrier-protein] ligase